LRRRVSPREARRMMQRMGVGLSEVPDVREVILRTGSKEIVVEDPEVAVLTVGGQKVYQVTGTTVTERPLEKEEREQKEQRGIAIPEEDVRLVADQTGKTVEEARKALEETGGDLAKAILLLQA